MANIKVDQHIENKVCLNNLNLLSMMEGWDAWPSNKLLLLLSSKLLISLTPNIVQITIKGAGRGGIEPPMAGPKPAALPLGYRPIFFYAKERNQMRERVYHDYSFPSSLVFEKK